MLLQINTANVTIYESEEKYYEEVQRSSQSKDVLPAPTSIASEVMAEADAGGVEMAVDVEPTGQTPSAAAKPDNAVDGSQADAVADDGQVTDAIVDAAGSVTLSSNDDPETKTQQATTNGEQYCMNI